MPPFSFPEYIFNYLLHPSPFKVRIQHQWISNFSIFDCITNRRRKLIRFDISPSQLARYSSYITRSSADLAQRFAAQIAASHFSADPVDDISIIYFYKGNKVFIVFFRNFQVNIKSKKDVNIRLFM